MFIVFCKEKLIKVSTTEIYVYIGATAKQYKVVGVPPVSN
jgi:hypothetical protein